MPTSVIVGSGALDAHFGAAGAEIRPYHLCKVIGTSTCDMMVVPPEEMAGKLIRGISGQVDGSVVPGLIGLEAGQSAFGDIYAWLKNLLLWTVRGATDRDGRLIFDQSAIDRLSDSIMDRLTVDARQSKGDLLALDWMNGRRTPDMNMHLKGAMRGLTLGTDAPQIYRALVEATAFGAKAIVERILDEGIRIEGVIALGGVAKKSEFVMQILADVLDMPVKVVRSEETCALGAAMFAAVIAGTYPTISEAQIAIGQGFEKTYWPIKDNVESYRAKYADYKIFAAYIDKFSCS